MFARSCSLWNRNMRPGLSKPTRRPNTYAPSGMGMPLFALHTCLSVPIRSLSSPYAPALTRTQAFANSKGFMRCPLPTQSPVAQSQGERPDPTLPVITLYQVLLKSRRQYGGYAGAAKLPYWGRLVPHSATPRTSFQWLFHGRGPKFSGLFIIGRVW